MKEGMTERKNLPWYKTILFKHICIFIITVLPGVLLFTNLYRTFQKEVMRNVTETTLSRDQQIFENFYSKIDEAQFYALNMYNEPDLLPSGPLGQGTHIKIDISVLYSHIFR